MFTAALKNSDFAKIKQLSTRPLCAAHDNKTALARFAEYTVNPLTHILSNSLIKCTGCIFGEFLYKGPVFLGGP